MQVDPILYGALAILVIKSAESEVGLARWYLLIFGWGIGILGTIWALANILGLKP